MGSVTGLTPADIPLNFVVLQDRDSVINLTPTNHRAHPSEPVVLPGTHFITRPEVIMDPSPYQVADGTLLSKVDFSFRMLKVTQAYVVRSGRLVGLLTRDRLTEYVGTREKKPMDRCMQLMGSCVDSLCCCCRAGRERQATLPRRKSYQVLPPMGGGGGGGSRRLSAAPPNGQAMQDRNGTAAEDALSSVV